METSHAADLTGGSLSRVVGALTLSSQVLQRTTRSLVQLVCFLPFLLGALVLQAKEPLIEADEWALYKTPHFEVMTTQQGDHIGELIEDISLFRAVVIALLGEGAEDLGSSRVRFLVLDRPGDVQLLFGGAPGVTGFTRPSLSGDLMVVGRPPARRMFALGNQVVFHEYVHQLVQMRSHSRHPAWYAEGIADFLSTLELRKDRKHERIVLGAMPESRKFSLRREASMSLGDVLETASTWALPESRRSSFYTQSWLLVHHLLLAEDRDERGFARSLATYLDTYDRGEAPLKAFESSFDLPLEDFPKRLERHQRRVLTIEYPLSAFKFDTSFERITLNRREATLVLARYIRESNPGEALRMLQALPQSGGASDAEVLAATAVTYAWLGQPNAAIEALTKAQMLGEDQFMVWLETGRTYRNLCTMAGKSCVSRNYQHLSGQAFSSAYKLDPDDVEARTRHAQYLLLTPERGQALPLLAASLAAAPWSYEILHAMGIAYLARGRLDLARGYLEKALGWSVDYPELQADVLRLLRQIELLDAGR